MRWVVNANPNPLYTRERPGTHCIGGWLGPRAGLDGYGKSRPHRDALGSILFNDAVSYWEAVVSVEVNEISEA
jgi:hypothetical protein